jgi:drug/metabolite transporter (DMT)-like permease
MTKMLKSPFARYARDMNAIILAVLAGVCWGIGELFTKSVLHSGKVGPLTAIAVRSTIALPVLWFAYFIAAHVAKVPPAPSPDTSTETPPATNG